MGGVREHIVRELSTGSKTYWQLLAQGSIHPSLLIKTLKQLEEEGIVAYPSTRLSSSQAQAFALTEEGMRLLKHLGFKEWILGVCPRCRGRAYVIHPALEGLLQELKGIARQRPEATQEFDQGPIPPENALIMDVVLYERSDLEGRDLLLLGDDDLTSVAAALTGLPRRIHVLEADPRLVEFLTDLGKRHGWKGFQVERYDARGPLPSSLRRSFDTFLTDPPETLLGFSLFLSRMAEALRGKDSAGYFGLSYLEASREKWQEIQRRLLQMNFVITEAIRSFHEYALDPERIMAGPYRVVTECPYPLPRPHLNWYTSTFFRLELLGDPRPSFEEAVSVGRDLYYDEEAYVTTP